MGVLSLKRASILVPRLAQSVRNASYIGTSLHTNRVSPVVKLDLSPALRQYRSFSMAANTTTITGDDAPLQQLLYFRKMAVASPFITEKAAPPEARKFEFPLGTQFEAPDRDVGLSMASMYAHAIRQYDICAIEVGWSDPKSQFILDVVNAMGCAPDTHSSAQGALWDVKFKPEGVYSEGTGQKAVSVSHSMGEFAWHTDAAFEEIPERFFGFHIIHPDKRGGGVFHILRAEDLVR